MDETERDRTLELLGLLFKAHPWHGVSPGPEAPGVVTAYIELVPTDTVKYEIDKATGILKVDRPQQFSNVCPALYGFIPRTFCGDQVAAFSQAHTDLPTLEGDGDPMDVCVLSEKAFTHGDFLLQATPLGGLRLIDRGQADDKIIAVLKGDAAYGEAREIGDIPEALIDRLKHYFLTLQAAAGRRSRGGRDRRRLWAQRGLPGDRAQPGGLPAEVPAARREIKSPARTSAVDWADTAAPLFPTDGLT